MRADSTGRGDSPTSGELPAFGRSARLAPEIHAWLDGRVPAPARRGDSAQDVDFWRRLEVDIARRREVRTPVHVQQAVMAALGATPRTAPAVVPWHRRNVTIARGLLALAGAALLALGLALGVALG